MKESFEKKNQRLFGKWSRVYNGFWFRLYFEPFYRHITRAIEQRKTDALSSGGSMLDIACGTAEILTRLAGKFPEASFAGIDMTAGMVEKAKEKTQQLSNVSITHGTSEKLPFPDAFFDVVLISDALHHMARPESVVREVRRVLKNDGLFLLVDPAKETPILILFGWLFKPLEKAHQYYSQDMLQELLAHGGFVMLETTRLFFNNFIFATVKK